MLNTLLCSRRSVNCERKPLWNKPARNVRKGIHFSRSRRAPGRPLRVDGGIQTQSAEDSPPLRITVPVARLLSVGLRGEWS